jgi:hypothetical protein
MQPTPEGEGVEWGGGTERRYRDVQLLDGVACKGLLVIVVRADSISYNISVSYYCLMTTMLPMRDPAQP